jgi:hypothetical protein
MQGGQSGSGRASSDTGMMSTGDSSVDFSAHSAHSSNTDAMAAMEEAFSGDLIGHSGEDDDKKEKQAGAAEEKDMSDEGPSAEGIEMADMKDIELSGDADRVTLAREGEADDKAMIEEAENDDVRVPLSFSRCTLSNCRNKQ